MSIMPTDLAGIAPVDQAQLPADVRKAGPKAEQLYTTALAFEKVLLQQLTSSLQATTQDGSSDDGSDSSDGSDGSDATTSTMMQMLPGAFAQGISSVGGIGIARELYNAMEARLGDTPSEVPDVQRAGTQAAKNEAGELR